MTHMAPGHVDLDSQQLSRSERNLIKLAKECLHLILYSQQ